MLSLTHHRQGRVGSTEGESRHALTENAHDVLSLANALHHFLVSLLQRRLLLIDDRLGALCHSVRDIEHALKARIGNAAENSTYGRCRYVV